MGRFSFQGIKTLTKVLLSVLFITSLAVAPVVAQQDTEPVSTPTPQPAVIAPVVIQPAVIAPSTGGNPVDVLPVPSVPPISATEIPWPPLLEELLELWRQYGSVSVDWETNTVTLTAPLSEEMLNSAVEQALSLLGMNNLDVVTNFVPDGMVVTITDQSTETVFELTYVVAPGGTSLELVSATINGESVPDGRLDDIDEAIHNAVENAIQLLLELLGLGDVEWPGWYSVQHITLLEDVMLLTSSIDLPDDVPFDAQASVIPW